MLCASTFYNANKEKDMTQALQDAWKGLENMALAERKKDLKVFKEFKSKPHWFCVVDKVHLIEVVKMTQSGVFQMLSTIVCILRSR